jgi:hypothetical protein
LAWRRKKMIFIYKNSLTVNARISKAKHFQVQKSSNLVRNNLYQFMSIIASATAATLRSYSDENRSVLIVNVALK